MFQTIELTATESYRSGSVIAWLKTRVIVSKPQTLLNNHNFHFYTRNLSEMSTVRSSMMQKQSAVRSFATRRTPLPSRVVLKATPSDSEAAAPPVAEPTIFYSECSPQTDERLALHFYSPIIITH